MTLSGNDLSFAFMRPLWLLGLLALPGLSWAWQRWRGSSRWENYIAPEKLRYLSIETSAARAWIRPLTVICLAVALLALAGPSWRSIPLPVKQPRHAMVIAFDLSPSMLARDLTPDRLTRARLKLIDLLRLREEGETALIAYADDAYRVSPLTDDASTIEALVPSLHPSVMPGPGSNIEAAVAMARELLRGASLEDGDLLIITDGIEASAFAEIEEELGGSLGLCILSVGSSEAVPIPLANGGFARDAKGQTILSRPNRDELLQLAGRHGGCFAEIQPDDSDLEQIQRSLAPQLDDALDETETSFDIRHDEGYWLVLFLLPFAALAFRRNTLWLLMLTLPLASLVPTTSYAVEWVDLWQRADQQAFRDVEEGIGLYRGGDYAGAAEKFDGESVIEHYNRGNALANAGKLEEALASYDQALVLAPDHDDARFNRDLIEELLSEQQDQDQQSQDQRDDPDQDAKQDPSSESQDEGSDGSEDGESGNQTPSDPAPETSDSEPSPSSSEGPSEEPPDAQAEDDERSQLGQEPDEEDRENDETTQAAQAMGSEQEPLSERSEQWLRNIPDDPGGLMRRKFQYEAELRRRREARGSRQPSATRY